MKEFTVDYHGYKVSSTGNVYGKSGKKLNPTRVRTDQRLYITLYYDRLNHWVAVDKLVAQLFIPNENPTVYKHVCHLDGDFDNNSVDNLMWCTKGVHRDRYKHMVNMYDSQMNLLKTYPSVLMAARENGLVGYEIRNSITRMKPDRNGCRWKYYNED